MKSYPTRPRPVPRKAGILHCTGLCIQKELPLLNAAALDFCPFLFLQGALFVYLNLFIVALEYPVHKILFEPGSHKTYQRYKY